MFQKESITQRSLKKIEKFDFNKYKVQEQSCNIKKSSRSMTANPTSRIRGLHKHIRSQLDIIGNASNNNKIGMARARKPKNMNNYI